MLKLKLQYFGHLMQRTDLLEKTLMLGKIGGGRRRGRQRMRWLDGITNSMDMSLSISGSWWWTGRPGVLRSMGSQRVGHDWVTELNWTDWNGGIDVLVCMSLCYILSDSCFPRGSYHSHPRGYFKYPFFLSYFSLFESRLLPEKTVFSRSVWFKKKKSYHAHTFVCVYVCVFLLTIWAHLQYVVLCGVVFQTVGISRKVLFDNFYFAFLTVFSVILICLSLTTSITERNWNKK